MCFNNSMNVIYILFRVLGPSAVNPLVSDAISSIFSLMLLFVKSNVLNTLMNYFDPLVR